MTKEKLRSTMKLPAWLEAVRLSRINQSCSFFRPAEVCESFNLDCTFTRFRALFDIVRRPEWWFGRAYVLPMMFFYLFRHAFSVVPQPIAAKLCHVIGNWFCFITQVQKFGGPSPKIISGQKHAKFRAIFYNRRLWSRISPEQLKISKSERRVI